MHCYISLALQMPDGSALWTRPQFQNVFQLDLSLLSPSSLPLCNVWSHVQIPSPRPSVQVILAQCRRPRLVEHVESLQQSSCRLFLFSCQLSRCGLFPGRRRLAVEICLVIMAFCFHRSERLQKITSRSLWSVNWQTRAGSGALASDALASDEGAIRLS
jgi:hypothetical protein